MSGGPRPTLAQVGQGVAAVALACGAVIALRTLGEAGGPIFSLGFLVIAGAVAGNVAAFVGLPRLTGYLVAGVLAGPQVSGFVAATDVKALSLINVLALALISLQAGAELTMALLQRTWRSVLWSSLAQVFGVVVPMTVLFVALAPRMSFVDGLSTGALWSVGLIWGVVALTRSPAITLAILSETKAKGPVAEHALGVAVLLDVLVLPLFAMSMSIASGQLMGLDFEIDVFIRLGRELFASVCAGTSFGLLIAVLLRLVVQDRLLMLVVLGYGVTALVTYLRYDTMLVFRVAGFAVMNLTRFGRELIAVSERLGSAVMIVFFATAGAKLDLSALVALWPVAVAMVLGRAICTYVAVQVGHRAAKDPPIVRRYGVTALVSQAGVTIGLATIVGDALPDLGRPLATLIIAVVGINELIGPVVFTWGLKRAGEVHDAAVTPTSA